MAKRTLVVYFSRTGITKQTAHELARTLDADLEEITEPHGRRGLMGYLRSSVESAFRQKTQISPAEHDPSKYDLVVIGTPVWNTSIASPVRTYLAEHGQRISRLAVFECLRGSGENRVMGEVAGLCGRAPVVEVALTDRDRERGIDKEKLANFVGRLRIAMPLVTRSRAAP